ncbi:putative RNA pseudouridine synthase [Andreprevotia sp. IGB-42]|uniref:pseudouridine synthase n=1 Tax=Andreprevotia sp. IGB-42 TaxID=2497473 RepID=UPI001356D7F4|nr:pseudouridine synthase [Andreprevotia sp. IGB-42]KAF0814790.1 putative RNA pseudouridine synthase [Andreprevotia sp. IGB-42]
MPDSLASKTPTPCVDMVAPDAALPAIVHVADDFVVAYKPAGLNFHREGNEPGLTELLRPQADGELYPLHRLDKLTSGLLLLARNAAAASEFGAMFAGHRLDKYYLALSARAPRKKQGTVAGAMLPARNGNWRLGDGNEQYAITQFFTHGLGNGLRLFLLRPLSGRTHQIRVAMKSVAAPILGDTRYGGEAADRGYLHAYALAFDWQGQRHAFSLAPATGGHFTEAAFCQRLAQMPQPWLYPWPSNK